MFVDIWAGVMAEPDLGLSVPKGARLVDHNRVVFLLSIFVILRVAVALASSAPLHISIRFPMPRHPTIEVFFAEMELQGIQCHGASDIDPSPEIVANIAALTDPPISVLAIASCCKMLHQQTGVDRNQNAWTKPAKDTEDPISTIRVLK